MENGYFKVANALSPLDALSSESTLYDADPVLYRIIQYFAGVITLHCQPRWNVEVAKLGRTDLVNKVINEVLPYDPLPLATDNQFRFPLLCAYRTNETYDWKTISWYNITSNIEILYILPPLTSDQGESLYPFLTHVSRVMVDRMAQGLDSNFNSGEEVWAEAGLEEIGMESCDYGKIPGLKSGLDSNMYFPAVSLKAMCKERRMPVPASEGMFEAFEGVDVKVKSHMDGYCDIDVAVVRLDDLDE